MLSILIPVFNYDVSILMEKILTQAENCEANIEVIIVDDCSASNIQEKNHKWAETFLVKYYQLEENIGRASIRNYLTDKASYQKLLFLDCDGEPVNDDFVWKYLKYTKYKVVCGGRKYLNEAEKANFSLHYTYGVNREEKAVERRKSKPYASFMTNNFMIDKEVVQKIPFNENVMGYGHEDTLFGYDLFKNSIPITHIDNPFYHIGLDENKAFLTKSIHAVKNLSKLIHNEKIDHPFAFNHIKLYKTYYKLRSLKMLGLVHRIIKPRLKRIENNLLKPSPNLRMFDLYRLYHFIQFHDQHTN